MKLFIILILLIQTGTAAATFNRPTFSGSHCENNVGVKTALMSSSRIGDKALNGLNIKGGCGEQSGNWRYTLGLNYTDTGAPIYKVTGPGIYTEARYVFFPNKRVSIGFGIGAIASSLVRQTKLDTYLYTTGGIFNTISLETTLNKAMRVGVGLEYQYDYIEPSNRKREGNMSMKSFTGFASLSLWVKSW